MKQFPIAIQVYSVRDQAEADFAGTMLLDNWGLEGKIVCAHGEDDKDVVPVVTAAGLTKTMAPRREDTIKTLDIPDIWPDIGEYYRNITACLEGRESPIVTPDQMRRVMRLIEAVFESARTGEVIRFEIPLEP